MGVSAAPGIFQVKMHSLIEGLEFVRYYLDINVSYPTRLTYSSIL